ncbi:uncharacterized protein [Malus domestica]|uniref:uncharacterized protein isoform X2 n=1 Tax=Malus domestica TaxID=3750 RepID=UPI000498A788|nr:uncharacterized protein LOC103434455 isoform X2 [Malus domestica]
MEHWETLTDRPVEEDEVAREVSLIHIEELKDPYEYVMTENWEGVQDFFEKNPEHLLSKITMDGGTVFHLAASCSSKSQRKNLKMVIDILRRNPSDGDVRRALTKKNNAGNNTLHEVSMTGNKEAAMYLVSIADKEKCALELLETRNSSGETSLFKAAAYGFTDLVKFYVGKLENYDRDNLWKHFHRSDKTSILHIAVVAQHFETALWLVENNPYLGPLKNNKGLTSLQLLAQMPTAFDPHFEKCKWKMLIYYCLPVGGDVVTPNQNMKDKDDVESNRKDDVESNMKDDVESNRKDDVESNRKHKDKDDVESNMKDDVESNRKDDVESNMKDDVESNRKDDVESNRKHRDDMEKHKDDMDDMEKHKDDVESNRKDDVESSMESNQPHRQSIFRNKLAGFVKVYISLRDSLAKSLLTFWLFFEIGGLIWEDKKNKKALDKLIPLLAKWDKSWCTIDAAGEDSTSMLSEKKGYDNGGEKRKAAVSDETNGDDGGGKEKDAAKSEKLNKDGDDGGKKGQAAASDKTNGDDGGGKKEELAKSKEEARNSSALLMATINGILPIVKEIVGQHPQAIEHVNYNIRNVLHLAIKYRRKEILNHIQSLPHVMPKLSKRIDKYGNTILHQAADRSYYSISLSQKLIGPAMQLQDEQHWMLRVQEMIPPHYTLHHNNKDQTAEELFNQEHDKLLEEAQKWVKETAQSCSTVAVLVATVVFAAAYAIPGGFNDQSGRPIFQDNPLFLLFTCMDVVAISCSLSSVAFFLSVLSSPLEYPLFVNSIPRKVMAGFILLFLSMATTMLAFAATILLVIRVKKKWTMSILYPIAFFPVPLFALLQFPMYQSFMVMLKTINAWVFKVFKPLLAFLRFHGSRRIK